MSRRIVSLMTTTALAVGALMMAAGPVLAQHGGHGGGHSGFSGGHGFGYGRGYYGGGNGYGRGFYGYGYGFGRGYYGFGRGYYGGFFPGFYGYGFGFSRGYYGYGYQPSFAYGSFGYVPNSAGYSYPVVTAYYSPPVDSAPSAVRLAGSGTNLADNAAHITIQLPADAEVWFDGIKTSQTGPVREFVSPPLDPVQKGVYQVRARWSEDGRPVEQTRELLVRANSWTAVDFTGPTSGSGMPLVPQPH